MSVFITGATGFIGFYIAKNLVENGETIHVLARPTSNIDNLIHPKIKIFYGDILNYSTIQQAVNGCDQIYHLAGYTKHWAKDPSLIYKVIVEGTRNVLEAAIENAVNKTVYTSSLVTFGPTSRCPVHETHERKSEFTTEYERSKFLAEKMIEDYVKKGLKVAIVNPTRVFGPGRLSESNSITRIFDLYLEGKWRLILGDGNAIANYAYIKDVAQGHILAMKYGKPGEKYILGGENITYNELFSILSMLSHKKRMMIHVPGPLAFAISKIELFRARFSNHYPFITPEWVRTFLLNWAMSSEKAQHELGYKITPSQKALKETIAWLKNKPKIGIRK